MRLLPILILLMLAGCAELPYYSQSLSGQWDVMRKARPIEDWLADEKTSESLKNRLRLVLRMRDFAERELALPAGDSYREYADLGRNWVVKNLFSAPEFSLEAKSWCHPFAGCIAYRGYFDEAMLKRDAEVLRQAGNDVHVARVAAYSTLGWFDDPVLNTFIGYPEPALAGMLFHELAHQRLYMEDDSVFNESYATAVQQVGVEVWLKRQGREQEWHRYRQRLEARRQVIDLIARAREDLGRIYDGPRDDVWKRRQKQQRLQKLRRDYQALARGFPVRDGFSRWMAGELNNAKLLSVATYHRLVPGFVALLQRLKGDFSAFHRAAESIAELSGKQREACLASLSTGGNLACGEALLVVEAAGQ